MPAKSKIKQNAPICLSTMSCFSQSDCFSCLSIKNCIYAVFENGVQLCTNDRGHLLGNISREIDYGETLLCPTTTPQPPQPVIEILRPYGPADYGKKRFKFSDSQILINLCVSGFIFIFVGMALLILQNLYFHRVGITNHAVVALMWIQSIFQRGCACIVSKFRATRVYFFPPPQQHPIDVEIGALSRRARQMGVVPN